MSSLFSFLRSEDPRPFGELESHDPADLDPTDDFPPNHAANPAEALATLTQLLEHFLPDHDETDPWPAPAVTLLEISEQPLAIGNRRGSDSRGIFPAVALVGGRLEAVARYQVWHDDLADVEALAAALPGALLTSKDDLWRVGVLRLTAVGGPPAERIESLNAWRRSYDFRLLYEYHNEDSEGAHSLIARIPVHAHTDREEELTVVTDEMVRWDNETAPTLMLRGPLAVRSLSLLSFTPAPAPGNTITLRRTFEGALGPPTSFANLTDFLNGTTDPFAPERHGEVSFATVTDFLNALTPAGEPIALGDWDEDLVPDQYRPFVVEFSPPLELLNHAEHLDLICEGAPLDQIAVVYVQAKR